MNRFATINTMQRHTLSAVAAAMLLGLCACSGMSTQDKNTDIGGQDENTTSSGIIGDEVGKYKH